MGLNETVDERVSFLKEQINPNNRPIVNDTFQVQIDILRNADRERVALLILQKKKLLESCKSVLESDKMFAQLEALEWLQRQVAKYV